MNRPIPDSYWVVPGKLLAGEYPCSLDVEEGLVKLTGLLDAGIRSFVDLTETVDGLRPYCADANGLAAERGLTVNYRQMSIRDLGIPTIEHMSAILEHINHEIAAGRPVYVHCWGGIGRTGTVVGCWMRATDGCTGEEAIDRIAELRRGTPDGFRRSPETGPQRDFLARWLDAM